MYEFLSNLLSDKKGGEIFTCFGIWHISYMLIFFGAIITTVLLLRNKSSSAKQRAINIAINCGFGLYMADFFLMPFAYGEIDIDKLPFHACTLTCVLCFMSRHNKFLQKFRLQFALVGLISNLIYMVYPAGVMWYEIHPLSYRAVQTLLFHGVMVAYGIFVLAFENVDLKWRKIYKELVLLVCMAAWAMLGNTLYSGTLGDYSRDFNWFFVKTDPFGILPATIAPFATVFAFMLADALIYLIYFGIRKMCKKRSEAYG